MPRPSQKEHKRGELLPVVARTFAELGYRRTTTAELARRCGVQENILYRLWPRKKAMFIAALDHVFALSAETWQKLLREEGRPGSAAERLLEYESRHHGEFGLYRIVFAGWSETDDPEIRRALRRMYRRFQEFIRDRVRHHRRAGSGRSPADAEQSAWAVVGLGTIASIGRELGLLSARRRRLLIVRIGRLLLDGGAR